MQEYLRELIDYNLPVYTVDILEIAISNMWLAASEPDDPCYSSAIGTILANISEALYEELTDYYQEIG